MTTRVLVVGAGGREHALAWKLRQSPQVDELFVAPGNAGTAAIATNVPIAPHNTTALVDWAKAQHITLAVIGPDNLLAIGLVDALTAAGVPTFGPRRQAALIESSKSFGKDLMINRGIPTAHARCYHSTELAAARADLHAHGVPIVIKGDGLLLGKGVSVCRSLAEAERVLADLFFHQPGRPVLIEDWLTGPEISLHGICSGTTALLWPPAQDYKRIGDGDTGPNTGGMGAVVPLPNFPNSALAELHQRVFVPALTALAERGMPFCGCLYPGLILPPDGWRVLEFNARFGDPELQSYLRLLDSDLYELLTAAVHGQLHSHQLHWQAGYAAGVVLAAANYPNAPRTGDVIAGLDAAAAQPGVEIFHAGTVANGTSIRTAGGRVLTVTAVGATLPEALQRAYAAVECISWPGMQYRRDIGWRANEPGEQWIRY